MANYFSKFPQTYYKQNDEGYRDIVTNIISRYAIGKEIRDNLSFYVNYTIKDGETPEEIAYKIYNSSERHWLVLAANDIIDVQDQWPLSYEQLNKYINQKYFLNGVYSLFGNPEEFTEDADFYPDMFGLIWAKNEIYAYYKTETIISSKGTTIEKFQVDANTYANANLVSVSTQTVTLTDGNVITINKNKETKTYYEYEYEENENKRNIRLLNFRYVEQVENELERVFRENTINLV